MVFKKLRKVSGLFENLGKIAYTDYQKETEGVRKLRLTTFGFILLIVFFDINILSSDNFRTFLHSHLLWIVLFFLTLVVLLIFYPFLNEWFMKKYASRMIKAMPHLKLSERFIIMCRQIGRFAVLNALISLILYTSVIFMFGSLVTTVPNILFKEFDLNLIFNLSNQWNFILILLSIAFTALLVIFTYFSELKLRQVKIRNTELTKLKHKLQFIAWGYMETIFSLANIIPTLIFRFFKNGKSDVIFVTGKLNLPMISRAGIAHFQHIDSVDNPDYIRAVLQCPKINFYMDIRTTSVLIDFGDYNIIQNQNLNMLNQMRRKIYRNKGVVHRRWAKVI